MSPDPFAARLHFIPRLLRRPQAALVGALRGYFSRAPGWVLLTTRGRKTGLAREVLLPCARAPDAVVVISTYGWRSHWIRNLRVDPQASVTCAGWVLPARAEILEEGDAKHAVVSAHPFFPLAPFGWVHAVLCTLLRPLLVLWLRVWVSPRPVVVLHRVDEAEA